MATFYDVRLQNYGVINFVPFFGPPCRALQECFPLVLVGPNNSRSVIWIISQSKHWNNRTRG